MTRLLFLLGLLSQLLFALPASAETKAFANGSWNHLLGAHQGRPLAVHVWSLTCAPCLAELPRWAEIQKRWPQLGIVLISTDPITEAPRLERTLTRAGLGGMESWAFADPFTEKLRFAIDPDWHGELPITRLIMANGQADTVVGSLGEEQLNQWLERQR